MYQAIPDTHISDLLAFCVHYRSALSGKSCVSAQTRPTTIGLRNRFIFSPSRNKALSQRSSQRIIADQPVDSQQLTATCETCSTSQETREELTSSQRSVALRGCTRVTSSAAALADSDAVSGPMPALSALLRSAHKSCQLFSAASQQRARVEQPHRCAQQCSSCASYTQAPTSHVQRWVSNVRQGTQPAVGTCSKKLRQNTTSCGALPVHELGTALLEESPVWTLDQIAGLAFGVGTCGVIVLQHASRCPKPASQACSSVQGLMLASVLLATKVDVLIARGQRRDLGLCEDCGGIYDPDLCNQGQCPSKTQQ